MQKYLIPRNGLMVRDPISFNPLPGNGMFVDWNGNAGRFWRRRVKCGDASIVDGEKLEELLKKVAEEKALKAKEAKELEEAKKETEVSEKEEVKPKTTSKRSSK